MKRRSFNKKAIIVSAWVAPTVSMVSLPSHAQATETPTPVATQTPTTTETPCLSCSENRFVAVPVGARSPAGVNPGIVGPEGMFDISNVCISRNTTRVEMVATNNNPFNTTIQGLEFDEALSITVTRPDGSTALERYTSFNVSVSCFFGQAVVLSTSPRPGNVDISQLFQDDSGNFIEGENHQINGVQCNNNQRWLIRSFDIVVTSDACP